MNTPFHRDITKEVFDAFRSQGIAAGVYYSPDDFWWLHQNGKTIERAVPGVQPRNNPGLMEYDQTQLRELLTHYGKIDALFLDGEAVGLRDLAWKLDPEHHRHPGSHQNALSSPFPECRCRARGKPA